VQPTVAHDAAEESPPTNQARSPMQMGVARAMAMIQKRHGPAGAVMRPIAERIAGSR